MRSNETTLRKREIRGLVEVYRRLKRERVVEALVDPLAERSLSSRISTSLRHVALGDELVTGFIEYKTDGRLPSRDEIEFLIDLLNHPRFDVVFPPIIPKLRYENYIDFLDAFLEISKSSNFR
ncbi:MAG: hypothetical protein DRP00_04635, partial [Candidatus Aenigmatarchaeota archaeon]